MKMIPRRTSIFIQWNLVPIGPPLNTSFNTCSVSTVSKPLHYLWIREIHMFFLIPQASSVSAANKRSKSTAAGPREEEVASVVMVSGVGLCSCEVSVESSLGVQEPSSRMLAAASNILIFMVYPF
jgi:hypothetical protein